MLTGSHAQWLWPADQHDVNQYVQLLQDFTAGDTLTSAQITISADTNYAIWLNGEFVGTGQWSNYPDDKTCDAYPVSLRPGANRIGVLAWYQGEDSSQYRKGEPGVLFAVEAGGQELAASGPATFLRRAPDYLGGRLPRVTPQLSFTFEYHADRDDGWRSMDYKPAVSWRHPRPEELRALSARPVRKRPIAQLTQEPRTPMRVESQGAFLRTDTQSSPAIAMQSDALSWRHARDLFTQPVSQLGPAAGASIQLNPAAWKDLSGPYIVLDAGAEEAGLLELEVEATSGTVIDVGYGEHLEDLRVRTAVGPRQFANRYICRKGRQTFLHPFLRIAGRYIELHILPVNTGTTQPLVLHYAGFRPTNYPATRTGTFECSDTLHNRIWEVSRRTLQLCMHEHYEDCPWREQSLYAMDSRNQALAGYYVFGNYDFAAASIDLLGKGLGKDGLLELCAPARIGITIPSFSLAWILMLDDHLLFGGDREFTRSQLPVAQRILQTLAAHTTSGLVLTPRGKRMWNYYEWAPGLDGSGRSTFGVLDSDRLDAPLNLFYILSLDAMARMSRECGQSADEFTSAAAQARAGFANAFWDAKQSAFRTYAGAGEQPHFAELTQALSILADVVPEGELDQLRERLARDDNGMVHCTLSHCIYKFDALLTDRTRFGTRVFDLIARDWGYMLNQGATTFWETIDGAAAFDNAGSLCHGWSGIPAYFYGRYILGIWPTRPGFAASETTPVQGIVCHARGIVPTPSGQLHAEY
jgi:hypothetical protein